MSERTFRKDLAGSDESLDDFLSRLKAQLSRPKARPDRDVPPDFGHFVTSRRPPGGAGGAGLLRLHLTASVQPES